MHSLEIESLIKPDVDENSVGSETIQVDIITAFPHQIPITNNSNVNLIDVFHNDIYMQNESTT